MNTIDLAKYSTPPAENPTEQEMQDAVASLVKYMKTFDTRPAKQAVLDNWPVLYYMFGNIDNEACTFRGERVLYKNRQYGVKLLNQAARGAIQYSDITSWTISPAIASRFAYYFVGTQNSLFAERKYTDRYTLSILLAGVMHEGDGLDLTDNSKLNTSFGKNEFEVIMPPGKLRSIIMSAAFIDKHNKIYVYEGKIKYVKEFNTLCMSLEKCCDNMNKMCHLEKRDEDYYEVIHVNDIDEFIELYEDNVVYA